MFEEVPHTINEIRRHANTITCMTADIYYQYTEIVEKWMLLYQQIFERPVKHRDAETLSHITNGYSTTLDVVESLLEELHVSHDQQYRKVLYGIIRHDLDARLALTNNCIADLGDIHLSFITKTPLIELSPEIEYNLPYLETFLNYKTDYELFLYNLTADALLELQRQIISMSRMVQKSFLAFDLNMTEFRSLKNDSIRNAQNISINWSELRKDILQQPLKKFDELNNSMQQVNSDVHGPLDIMPVTIQGMSDIIGNDVNNSMQQVNSDVNGPLDIMPVTIQGMSDIIGNGVNNSMQQVNSDVNGPLDIMPVTIQGMSDIIGNGVNNSMQQVNSDVHGPLDLMPVTIQGMSDIIGNGV